MVVLQTLGLFPPIFHSQLFKLEIVICIMYLGSPSKILSQFRTLLPRRCFIFRILQK